MMKLAAFEGGVGVVHFNQGRLQEALESYETAMRMHNDPRDQAQGPQQHR